MALTFPTLASGFVFMYPMVQRDNWRTQVYRHIDLSEQRNALGVQLQEFDLELHNLSTADKQTVRNFFTSTGGNFDATWTLSFTDTDGVQQTYTYMQFATNTFSPEMTGPGRWSVRLSVRQTRGGLTNQSGTLTAFPQINSRGVYHQLPYTEEDQYSTVENALPSGAVFTYLQNSQAIVVVKDKYSAITKAELQTIQEFYDQMRGRLGEFSWTDNSGTTWPYTRFDMDALEFTATGPGVYSTDIQLLVQLT